MHCSLLDKREDKKDLDMSIAHKLSGNQEFQVKNYAASLELYTKSAIYAPQNSDELPIAIGNRSASLFHLGRWEVNNIHTLSEDCYFYDCQKIFLSFYTIYIFT